MSYEYYIARRLFADTSGQRQVSRPAVKIAIVGIAVGLAVMLLAVAIVLGFKHQVEENVMGLSAHIQVTGYRYNISYEQQPMQLPDTLPAFLRSLPNVRHVQRFSTKPGVIKTGTEVQAVVFKGVAADFDWDFLRKKLTAGEVPCVTSDTLSADVLISTSMARRLRLDVGDTFLSYFLRNERMAARKWRVCGLFDTHFKEYDDTFVLVDDRQIGRLNGWAPDQTGGLEVFVADVGRVPETDGLIYGRLFESDGPAYTTRSVYDLNPEIFGWLDLLDTNVWLILLLMLFVSAFNMISGLLILILERTGLIGLMKAMGASDASVRKIFLWLAFCMMLKGVVWGDVIGLGLCALQYFFHLVPLDAAVYYIDAVPIEWNAAAILAVNLGSVAVSMLMMLLPSALVSRILPARSIRFD